MRTNFRSRFPIRFSLSQKFENTIALISHAKLGLSFQAVRLIAREKTLKSVATIRTCNLTAAAYLTLGKTIDLFGKEEN